jgi:hypothetical protein
MAADVMVTIVMAMPNADAHTDATNMNADDSGVGRARTQQGQGKNRSDKCFHDSSLPRNASSASFADLGVDSYVALLKGDTWPFVPNRTI